MTRSRDVISWTVWMGLVALAMTGGCGGVRVQDSPKASRNTPMRDPTGVYSNIKGMPQENLDYFKAKYPPDSWQLPASDNRVCLVGPAVFSQAAVNILRAAPGSPPATTGNPGITMTTDAGQVSFMAVKQFSGEVQSVVIQELTNTKVFQVKSIDDATGINIYRGTADYSTIAKQRINHFVECTVGSAPPGDDNAQRFRVYLRLIDTRSSIVTAATSGVDKDLMTAAQKAAVELAKIVSSRQ
ncbi:MAG: hypothetical protein NTV86_19245 [Planctomycetota bacterium]|nr:hypothetical protein [Planctomycetota bacterium]